MSNPLKEDTVRFIFQYIQGAPELQGRDIDALDTKVVQVFSAASVVIGLVGISNESLGTSRNVDVLLVLAVVSYTIAAVAALFHLSPKKQRRSLHVEDIWQKSWNEEVTDIEHALIEDIREVHNYNKGVLEKKRKTLLFTVAATGAEVLFVGLTLISSRFPGFLLF